MSLWPPKPVTDHHLALELPRAAFETAGSGDTRSLQFAWGIIDAAKDGSVLQWAMNLKHHLTETALNTRPASGERAHGALDWMDVVWGVLDGLLDFLLS